MDFKGNTVRVLWQREQQDHVVADSHHAFFFCHERLRDLIGRRSLRAKVKTGETGAWLHKGRVKRQTLEHVAEHVLVEGI